MSAQVNTYTDIPHGGYSSRKEYYENNKIKYQLATSLWRLNNREHVNERAREYMRQDINKWYCEACDHEMRKNLRNRHCQSFKHMNNQMMLDAAQQPEE